MDPAAVSTTTNYTIRDQERMKKATRYFEWQSRLVTGQLGSRVLEIGCGMGNFTGHLLDRECVVGIDTESACIEHLGLRYRRQANLFAYHLDVLDPAVLELKRHDVNSIVCLNVLEHVRDDRQALLDMRELLPVGGRAVLIIPAFDALYGPIDAKLGHYRRYSKGPWIELVRSLGFAPRILRYINSVGCVGWWANAKVFKRTEQSENQIAVFDRFIVPVLSRVESVIEPPFGQSIFTVIEKTS